MKLFGSNKNEITKNKNCVNVLHLEIIRCNTVNNDYQQDSRVLYTIVYTLIHLYIYTFAYIPNKSFGQLLDVSHKSFIFPKTFDSEFSYIELWLTDQNSKPLETEDKRNITLVIN